MSSSPHVFLRLSARVIGPLLRVSGLEHLPPTGPFIVAGSHESFADVPALSTAIFRARHTLLRYPTSTRIWKQLYRLFGSAERAASFGVLPIDDSNPSAILEASRQLLASGGCIGIFPEGRRNNSNQLLRGKTGAVRLALASRAPIIPASVRAGRGQWFDLIFRLLFRRPIFVRFGPAFVFSSDHDAAMTKERMNELTDELMRRIGKVSGKTITPRL